MKEIRLMKGFKVLFGATYEKNKFTIINNTDGIKIIKNSLVPSFDLLVNAYAKPIISPVMIM